MEGIRSMTGPKVTPRAKRHAEPYPTPPDSQRQKRTQSKPGRDRRFFSPSATPGPSSFPGAYIRTPSPLTTAPAIPSTPETDNKNHAAEHTTPSSLSSTIRSASPDSPAASRPHFDDVATPSATIESARATTNPFIALDKPTPAPTTSPTRSRSQSTWADATGAYAAILGLWSMCHVVSGEVTPAGGNVTDAGKNNDGDSHAKDLRPSSGPAGAQNSDDEVVVVEAPDANNKVPTLNVIDLCDDSDSDDEPELGDIDDTPGRAAARRLGRDTCQRLLGENVTLQVQLTPEYRHQSSIYRLMRGATVPEGGRQLRVACYDHVARTFNLDPERAEDIAAFDVWAREYLTRVHGMRMVLELAFGTGP